MRPDNRTLADALPLDERAAFVRADTKRAVYISIAGNPPKSWPALKEAERNGHLSDAIHLRRLKGDAVAIISGF